MENTLTQFSADNLEIKLTSEKLFISTIASSEAFALRSINGIGVVDLIDDYNKALTAHGKVRQTQKVRVVFGILSGIVGLGNIALDMAGYGIFLLIVGAILAFIGIKGLKNAESSEPKLMSAVRIMMSGGNRDFQFDKSDIKSGNVAEFVAKVESTLTAYHKKDD